MATNPLADLKDLHSPTSISVFPLAPGWYLLLIMVILFFGIIIWLKFRKQTKRSRVKEIYALFENLEQNSTNNTQLLADLSIFLKRVAISQFPDQQIQLKFGKEWLLFLDQTGKTTEFSNGIGKCLANTYQANAQSDDYHALFKLIKEWLRIVL